MPRWTRAELEAFRGAEVPDLVGPGVRLVFVGINPGLLTAARQVHFGNPANRFRPALVAAGLLDPPVDGVPGMTEDDLAALVRRGVGITNLVPFATARADELSREQLLAGRARLESFVAEHRPRVVAVLGITAYRTSFGRPRATPGRQPDRIGDAELWVVPNPSGLNAHESVASLAAAYAAPARAAGIRLDGFVVESGGVADLDLLEPLWVAVHHQHQRAMPDLRPYVSDATTWRERRALYDRLFAEHDPILLLGRDRGELVGYALGYTMAASGTWLADTWATGERIGEVESLSVLPGHRGRGWGSRLLEELHEQLRRQGATDLVLGALAGNADAIRLYERHGYRPTWLYLSRLDGRGSDEG